jgi:hypothetical protein
VEDRELLELAAKAAGRKYDVSRDTPSGWALAKACEAPDGDLVEDQVWRPLTCDGDALQLAVKLELDIRHTPGSTHVFRHQTHLSSEHHGLAIVRCRKAIVRAAAEIGRAMP